MTTPSDLDGYEKRVLTATQRLDSFFAELVGDLDLENGAFKWWGGYSDWKTLTLLADYLMQSVQGASDALLSASLAAQTNREMAYSEQTTLKLVWNAVAKTKARSTEAYMAAIPRDRQARRRAQMITQSTDAVFFHLGQALDRLGAAVIIVAGIDLTKVSKDPKKSPRVTDIHWSTAETIATELDSGTTKEHVQPAGSSGRAAQEQLMATLRNPAQFGPDSWLSWMRDTRNSLTHRPPGKRMNVQTTTRITRLLYRQPKWSELQSLLFGGRPPRKPFFDAFISSASEDILEGLVESTAGLMATVTDAMRACWDQRRADPTMIVQHGGQWKTVEPSEPLSPFPGYGEPLVIKADMLMLNTLDSARWEAARAQDDRRRDWYA